MTTTVRQFSFDEVRHVLGGVLGLELHSKRVDSLCDATLGVLRSASLAVAAIGHGLAAARGLVTKHAIKQVDRLLSNPDIKVDDILALWVPFVVGARTSIAVAMDWTDFDADNQATVVLSLITEHGRATPLVWLTVDKRTLKDQRNLQEDRLLLRLAEILPTAARFRPGLNIGMARTAWVAMTRGKAQRQPPETVRPRVDAGVKEQSEMTIGRTEDPENPRVATAFKAASVFGTGSRTPSGPAVMSRVNRPDT